ncbi:glycogenin 1 isoform X2 [Lycorma delicatula]|uniref:glycogenin 1 isoform X2 n=1 Tax=Lycorma delicatula TaxID=130591 RepID=UPI003F5102BA
MGGFAWVTLATNDSYSLGALVLAHSLKRVNTAHQLAVMITPGVSEAMRTQLSAVFNVVKVVDVLDSQDQDNLALLSRPELGITFTKLHCWRLTQFDKCVFLDADTIVLQNSDELFEREELSAAPDIGWPDCFNSGVFVFKPSDLTYKTLIEFALVHGTFDGGDQGLLNLFFSDWATKDISKHLPFVYNVVSSAMYTYLPAFKQFQDRLKIIHFIGSSKPWLQPFDTETGVARVSSETQNQKTFIQLWWDLFCAYVHPTLTSNMAGLAGALSSIKLGTPLSEEETALQEHLRRQGWEEGNIDYMGRDSFDNIWKKICETLADVTPSYPSTTPSAVVSPATKSAATAPEPLPTQPSATVPLPSESTPTGLEGGGVMPPSSQPVPSPLESVSTAVTSSKPVTPPLESASIAPSSAESAANDAQSTEVLPPLLEPTSTPASLEQPQGKTSQTVSIPPVPETKLPESVPVSHPEQLKLESQSSEKLIKPTTTTQSSIQFTDPKQSSQPISAEQTTEVTATKPVSTIDEKPVEPVVPISSPKDQVSESMSSEPPKTDSKQSEATAKTIGTEEKPATAPQPFIPTDSPPALSNPVVTPSSAEAAIPPSNLEQSKATQEPVLPHAVQPPTPTPTEASPTPIEPPSLPVTVPSSTVPSTPQQQPSIVPASEERSVLTPPPSPEQPTPFLPSPQVVTPSTPTITAPTPPTSPPAVSQEPPLNVAKLKVQEEIPQTPPVTETGAPLSLPEATGDEPPVPPKRKGGKGGGGAGVAAQGEQVGKQQQSKGGKGGKGKK